MANKLSLDLEIDGKKLSIQQVISMENLDSAINKKEYLLQVLDFMFKRLIIEVKDIKE